MSRCWSKQAVAATGMKPTDMSLQLSQTPQPGELQLHPERTLLQTLQQAGHPWRVACRNGVCGICACKLLVGTIDYKIHLPRGLNQQELDEDLILPCIAYPTSQRLQLSGPCYPRPVPRR
jgi:ferredoxin